MGNGSATAGYSFPWEYSRTESVPWSRLTSEAGSSAAAASSELKPQTDRRIANFFIVASKLNRERARMGFVGEVDPEQFVRSGIIEVIDSFVIQGDRERGFGGVQQDDRGCVSNAFYCKRETRRRDGSAPGRKRQGFAGGFQYFRLPGSGRIQVAQKE